MASSSSMPLPPLVKGKEPTNWSELPPELMSSIMGRLGVVEILENVQLVCRPWRRVSKDPSLWRKIDMGSLRYRAADRISFGINFDSCYTDDRDYFANMCRNAVDRSEGGLVEISIGPFCTDSIITYIADRSSNLRKLGLYNGMTHNGLENAVAKLPLLEELEVSHTWLKLDLKVIGHSCPKLKTLKLNCSSYRSSQYKRDDDDALAIAETMPQLHQLQLIANRLTDTGLNAILDNCPQLEHLDLRQCLNLNLSGDLEKQCLERVKDFRRPIDSTADYPYYAVFYDSDDDFDIWWCDHFEEDYDFRGGNEY